jgi:MoaA/NifB/PqqE/SkfB family radical SAM enzyme
MLPVIASRLLKWEEKQQYGPWRLKVFPTYRCNLDCGICVRNWHPTDEALLDELTDERWLRLVDEAAELGARVLIIGGGGEPMVRENLIRDMCVRAKKHGMEGFLQTNGVRMSLETIQTLISIGWDQITISVDGPDSETNDIIRCKGAFEKTCTLLHKLLDEKHKRKTSFPRISIHTIITAQNYDRLDLMVPFCQQNFVDLLSISPLLEEGMGTTQYVLSDVQRTELPGILERTANLAHKRNLPCTINAMNITANKPPNDILGPGPLSCLPDGHIARAKCLQPWTEITIVSSGHVSPCCFFWEHDADTIRVKTLREVWTGAYFSQLRQKMYDTLHLPYCRQCYYPFTPEHSELLECVQHTALSHALKKSIPKRVFASVKKYGLWGTLRRFHEWWMIRSAMD